MDQSCWYCVVKLSSTALVQPVSSISTGPAGIAQFAEREGRAENGAAGDGDVGGVGGGDQRAMTFAELAFPADVFQG